MAASTLALSSSSSSSKLIINATLLHLPNQLRTSKLQKTDFSQDPAYKDALMTSTTFPLRKTITTTASRHPDTVTLKLYAILDAIADRVEMHANVREQRENWNALLLNSINMITLTATTMVGMGAMAPETGYANLALSLGSTLLFLAATGMLVIMNTIQPSQLVEEQRNATRLFKQLHSQIQTRLALSAPTQEDVEEMMEKVLALDKAYPLPLLGGVMLEKFPKKFEPAVWWPRKHKIIHYSGKGNLLDKNGWNEEMEMEMREVIHVIKGKDKEDYERLGKIGLKVNRVLAISGPVLTGIAAVGSAFVGLNNNNNNNNPTAAGIVGASAGALAAIVNTMEHGGQVGMVVEMYRNCAGFFQLMEESIESTLEEEDLDRRENGELFEMKLALQLGRSLSQLKEITQKSASFRRDQKPIDEFASKLF